MIEYNEIIEILYNVILGRKPDQEGLDYYVNKLKSKHDLEAILKIFITSKEFNCRYKNLSIRYKNHQELFLGYENNIIPWSKFHEVYEKCINKREGNEYYSIHKKRFYELINTFLLQIQGISSPRVLEIGISDASRLYSRFLNDMEFVSIDRPIEDNGLDAESASEIGSLFHYNIDLNNTLLNPYYGEPALGEFDYIICTEVLEHLIINPVDFISGLVSLLTDTGKVYLTTPNFFCMHNYDCIGSGINPQKIYPRVGENWDAHHHHREYEMIEMIECISESGGLLLHSYWSDCWDSEVLKGFLDKYPFLRSNMVFLFDNKYGAVLA